jgi:glycosyltransferase involved in cell wall biosynthesis
MRLGIDSRDLFATNPRGVGRTLWTFIRYLAPLVGQCEVNLYTDRWKDFSCPRNVRVRKIEMRGDRLNLWERVRLPLAAWTDRLDLLHCPSQTAPPVVPCPFVLTVHDLIPLRIGDGWSATEADRFRRALGHSVQKARRIIAISEFTKNDLLSTFKVAESKVDVVCWGVDTDVGETLSQEIWESLCRVHQIRNPFFVAFGGDAPRKNVPRLFEALRSFVNEVSKDVQLLLLGVPEGARAKYTAIAESLDLSDFVVQTGYVPDSTVAHFLAKSEALIYASLYEGFGLPILEAMARGTPVITSNVTSMPEIAGEAALLVDPKDFYSIKEAMRLCYLNSSWKDQLRIAGHERVKNFTWERTARETLAVYTSALL